MYIQYIHIQRDWPLCNWLQNQDFIWAWKCLILPTVSFFLCFIIFFLQVFCIMYLSSHFFSHPSACWTLDHGSVFAVSTQTCRKLTQKILNTTRGHLQAIAKTHNMFSPLRHCNPDLALLPTATKFNYEDMILTSWKHVWRAFPPFSLLGQAHRNLAYLYSHGNGKENCLYAWNQKMWSPIHISSFKTVFVCFNKEAFRLMSDGSLGWLLHSPYHRIRRVCVVAFGSETKKKPCGMVPREGGENNKENNEMTQPRQKMGSWSQAKASPMTRCELWKSLFDWI